MFDVSNGCWMVPRRQYPLAICFAKSSARLAKLLPVAAVERVSERFGVAVVWLTSNYRRATATGQERSAGYRAPAGLNFTGCWTALGRRGHDQAGDTISKDQAPLPPAAELFVACRVGRGPPAAIGRRDDAATATTSARRDGAGAICNLESALWRSLCGPGRLVLPLTQ